VIADSQRSDGVAEAATKTGAVLGLPAKTVRLTDHDSVWPELFRREEALLRQVAGGVLLSVQHIGSSCIPGLKAKPIIDILGGVETLAQGQELALPLRHAGYHYLGGHLVPEHHVYGKGDNRTHLLHIVEYNGAAWRRVIAFRDILLKYPDVAARYETLKIGLSRQFPDDRPAYGEAKTAHIDRILAEFGPAL